MKKRIPTLLLCLSAATLLSCNKPFTCSCAGGIGFQQYEKEIKAPNSKKAREKCEADNLPPNTPDVINCWLK